MLPAPRREHDVIRPPPPAHPPNTPSPERYRERNAALDGAILEVLVETSFLRKTRNGAYAVANP